jgi:hypothetical protein
MVRRRQWVSAVAAGVAVVLLAAMSTSVSGLQITSQRRPLKPTVNALESYILTGFRAQRTDVGVVTSLVVQNDAGDDIPVKFSLDPVLHVSAIKYDGVVPRTGLYLESEACTTRNTVKYAPANDTASSTASGEGGGNGAMMAPARAMARSLLQLPSNPFIPESHPRGTPGPVYPTATDWPPTSPDNAGSMVDAITVKNVTKTCRCNFAVCTPENSECTYGDDVIVGTFPRSQVTAALCTQFFSQAMNPAGYNDCLRGPSFAALQALNTTTRNLVEQLKKWSTTLGLYENATAVAAGALLKLQFDQNNYTMIVQKRLNNLQDQITLTNDTINGVAEYATAELERQRNIAVDINTNLIALALNMSRVVNATDSDAQRVYAAIVQDDAIMMQNFLQTVTVYRDNRKLIIAQIQDARRQLVDAATAFMHKNSERDMIRKQSKIIHTAIASITSRPTDDGETLLPFNDPGDSYPPATNPFALDALHASILISDSTIRYVVQSAGTPYGVSTRIRWRCETIWLLSLAPKGPSASLMATWIGRSGCDPTFTSSTFTNRCRCAPQVVSDQRCLMRNSAGVVSSADLLTWRNGAAGDMSANVSCLLDATDVPGGMTGLYMDNSANLTTVLATISRRGVYPGTGYQVDDLLTGRVAQDIAWSASVSNMTNFVEILNQPSETGVPNLVYAYATLQEYSYAAAYKNLDFYERYVYGDIPNYMDQRKTLYKRLPGGESVTCNVFGGMFYSNTFLTVSSHIPSTIVVNARLTINGENVTLADLTMQNNYQGLLPISDGIVWDPTSPGEWWDTVSRDVAITENYGQRRFSITAMAAPNPASFRRDYLSYWAGRDFEHEAGGYVAAPLRVQIDTDTASPTYGQCKTRATVPGGGWCKMFEHFIRTADGVLNDPNVLGRMTYEAKDATVDFTARLPNGQVTLFATSKCPTLSLAAERNATTTQILVTVTNPADSANVFRLQQEGACPSTTEPTLAAHQSVQFAYTACRNAPVDTPDVVRAYTFVNGAFQPCSANVTLDARIVASRAFVGAATLGESRRLEQLSSGVLFVQAARSDMIIAQAQALTALHKVDMMIARNMTVTTIHLTALRDLVGSIGVVTPRITDAVNATRRNLTDAIDIGSGNNVTGGIDDVTNSLAARRARLNAQQEQSRQESDAALLNLFMEQYNLTAKVDNVKRLGAATVEQFQVMVLPAILNFTTGVLQLINHTAFSYDRFGALAVDIGEKNIDKAAIQGTSDFFDNAPWSSIGGMFGATTFGWRIAAVIFFFMMILVTALWMIFFVRWLAFRCAGCVQSDRNGGKTVGPLSSRLAYRVDEQLTQAEKFKSTTQTRDTTELGTLLPSSSSSRSR